MLNQLLGADEHTALDGAYTRAIKTRKWVYVSGSLVVVSIFDLYSESNFNNIIKIFSVPSWLFEQASFVGFLYVAITYIFFIIQLMSSYNQSLKSRIESKKSDELKSLSKGIYETLSKISTLRSNRSKMEQEFKEMASLLRRIERAKSQLSQMEPDLILNKEAAEVNQSLINEKYNSKVDHINHLRSRVKEKGFNEAELRSGIESLDEEINSLDIDLGSLRDEFYNLRQEDLSLKPFYVWSEIAIDFVRFSSPLFLIVYVINQKIWL